MNRLTKEQILRLHLDLIETFGGGDGPEVFYVRIISLEPD